MSDPTIRGLRRIELHYDVTDFPVVEAEHFKPVLADRLELTIFTKADGARYLSIIRLKGRAAKKDGTPARAQGHLWFHVREDANETPGWLLDLADRLAAPYLAAVESRPTEDSCDDEPPAAEEFPAEEYDMPVGPPWSGDEEPSATTAMDETES